MNCSIMDEPALDTCGPNMASDNPMNLVSCEILLPSHGDLVKVHHGVHVFEATICKPVLKCKANNKNLTHKTQRLTSKVR